MKKIFDVVHGFIHFDEIETRLLHSEPFQRLQYIHQLGTAFYVYPGGTHKRFEHSIGVMELASRIYDQITETSVDIVPKRDSFEYQYWRKILRLAALCHDLGHLPFSHVAEKALLGAMGHEALTIETIKNDMLKPIWEEFSTSFDEPKEIEEVILHILKIAVGEDKLTILPAYKEVTFSPWEKILTEIITGDFFGTDRMDYLLRDAKCTGLAYGSFDYHQLIEMLRIFPDPSNPEHCVLGVEENGIESCESLLLARHFMHRRIYQYPSVKAYGFHFSRFMKNLYHDSDFLRERYYQFTDNQVLVDLIVAARDSNHPGNFDALCITERGRRFKALSFAKSITEERLEQIQRELDISSLQFTWSLSGVQTKEIGLSFPVLCQDNQIVRGEEVSQIKIPFTPLNWIFVDPQFENKVTAVLKVL